MNKYSTAQLLMLSLLGSVAFSANAAQDKASGVYQFEQITVLGSAKESEVFVNPASVSVVGQEEIKNIAPQSVASYLRKVPGVQIIEEGVERISIRGEGSNRVAITIDGQKLSDHSGYGQPLLIDPASIERIEVLRGSSSVVSGSRAIGGVVNIITKKGAGSPLEVTTSAGYFSATRGYRTSSSLAGSQNGFDYRLGFSRSELGDRQTANQRLKPSNSDDKSYSAHLGYSQGKHSFAVKAMQYDVAAKPYTEDYDLDIDIDLPKRELTKYALFYQGDDLTEQVKKLKIDVFQQDVDRKLYNNITFAPGVNIIATSDDQQRTRGINTLAELELINGQDTVVGLEYEQDKLDSDKNSLTPGGPQNDVDKASITTRSAFIQHAIPLHEDITATLGARHYRVEAKQDKSLTNGASNSLAENSDSHTVGAASLVWQPSDEWVLRTNVSQGYVYPTLGQLFQTTISGGTQVVGNPNLKPETSTTYETGARFQDEGWMLDANLFYSRAKNYIKSVKKEPVDPAQPRLEINQNLDQANSFGLELQLEKELVDLNLTPYVTGTLMRRELKTA
ncbi:MAG: TonB-dependent receptor plug domain-containing protein, partial [Oceanisphaera sp.]|uniref:TonB-dependent receptor plug domain-containing protein n=1 Tax=Oceanisphaera sp. TaxID=1929979 RepID=UPI003F9BF9D2